MTKLLGYSILALSLIYGFSGCSMRKQVHQIQCLEPVLKAEIEGPIVIEGDNVIFYDAKDRLVKRKSSTCGIK